MKKNSVKDEMQHMCHPTISDEDAELVVAYVENRLDNAAMARMKARLSKDENLRQALSDLVMDTRGTEYEKILEDIAGRNPDRESVEPGKIRRIATIFKNMPDALSRSLAELTRKKGAAIMVTGCLAAVISVSTLLMKAPDVHIRLLASPDKMVYQYSRTVSPVIKEVPPGGELKSRSYFKISVDTDKPAWVSVFFHDSSGNVTSLIENRRESGMPLIVSEGPEGYQLDDYPGRETVYVLSSEVPVKEVGIRATAFIKRNDIKGLSDEFPGVSVRTFYFEHR